MKSKDVLWTSRWDRLAFAFEGLLARARLTDRANWTDLPRAPGIYLVCWTGAEQPIFSDGTGEAKCATPVSARCLQERWKHINQAEPTDIIYIGKGDDLRNRVRALARFGIGKAKNHKGGEWMWQITDIPELKIILHTCPLGKQVAFEGFLLERFCKQHGSWPLANINGPSGTERWSP